MMYDCEKCNELSGNLVKLSGGYTAYLCLECLRKYDLFMFEHPVYIKYQELLAEKEATFGVPIFIFAGVDKIKDREIEKISDCFNDKIKDRTKKALEVVTLEKELYFISKEWVNNKQTNV